MVGDRSGHIRSGKRQHLQLLFLETSVTSDGFFSSCSPLVVLHRFSTAALFFEAFIVTGPHEFKREIALCLRPVNVFFQFKSFLGLEPELSCRINGPILINSALRLVM